MDSVVKSTGCCSRGPCLDAQLPVGSTQLCEITVPRNYVLLSLVPTGTGLHVVHTNTCRRNTHTHICLGTLCLRNGNQGCHLSHTCIHNRFGILG